MGGGRDKFRQMGQLEVELTKSGNPVESQQPSGKWVPGEVSAGLREVGKRREAENQMRASSAFSGVAQWISNLLYQGCQKGRIPFST